MENNQNSTGFVSYTTSKSLFGIQMPPLVHVSSLPKETEIVPEAKKAEDMATAAAKAVAEDMKRRQQKRDHGLTQGNLSHRLMGATLKNMERGMPYGSAALRACRWMRNLVDEDSSLPSHADRKPLRDYISAVEATAHPPFTVERVSDLVAKRAKKEEERGAKPREAVRASVNWVKSAIWRDSLRITNAKERETLLAAANACLPPPKEQKPRKTEGKKVISVLSPLEEVRRAFADIGADKRLACAQAFIHRCVESIKLTAQEKSEIMTLIEDEVMRHFKAPILGRPTTLAEVGEAEAEAKRWMDSKIEYAQRKLQPKAHKPQGNRFQSRTNVVHVQAEPPRAVEPKPVMNDDDRRIAELKARLRTLEIALRQSGTFMNGKENDLLIPFAEEFARLRGELDELLAQKAAQDAEREAANKAERIRRAEASAKASRELPRSLVETPAESRKRHRERQAQKAAKEKGGKGKNKGGKKKG